VHYCCCHSNYHPGGLFVLSLIPNHHHLGTTNTKVSTSPPTTSSRLVMKPLLFRRSFVRPLLAAGTSDQDDNESDYESESTSQKTYLMSKLTIPELKEKLRQYQLPVSGKKQVLIDRLLAHYIEDDDDGTTVISNDVDDLSEINVQRQGETEEILSFEELGIDSAILPSIRAQPGWDVPTPVQQLAIPKLLLLDRTMIDESSSSSSPPDAFWCEAPTGSGKTAAYAIPLLQNLLLRRKEQRRQDLSSSATAMNGKKKEKERISALVLCPTRELAVQIGTVIEQLARNISWKSAGTGTSSAVRKKNSSNDNADRRINTMVLHGGVPYEPQLAQLADYARTGQTLDILVATPGRLVDILTHYAEEGGDMNARDAAMERRLLLALDTYGDDVSLEQLQSLGLDTISSDTENSDDGRSSIVHLLDGLQYIVLDEADRLLGGSFQSELDALLDLMPNSVDDQNDDGATTTNEVPAVWMFSATFPKAIEPRLDRVLRRLGATKSPVRVQCSNSDRRLEEDIPVSSSLKKKLEKSTTVTSAPNFQQVGPASTIQLRTIRLEKPARTQALRKLLEEDYKEEWDRVLVFVATRYASEHVSRKLRRAGINSSELHGKLDQDARLRRLDDLKKGKIRVLLSTDVASRGIDISGLAAVVNYDLPRSTADFVHRIGRTGRAGKEGLAVTFVTPSDEAHMDLIEQRHLARPTEREVLSGFEPNEDRWRIAAEGSRISSPDVVHSPKGLVHDRMFGGIKGRRKSKKDRLREAEARAA
jgi:superfamily II DNA/RNA helicase